MAAQAEKSDLMDGQARTSEVIQGLTAIRAEKDGILKKGDDVKGETGHRRWIAIDHVKFNHENQEEVERNPYIDALFFGELAESCGAPMLALAHEDSCCRTFFNQNRLKKELTEALGALRLVAQALEYNSEGDRSGQAPGIHFGPGIQEKPLFVIDMCSGKGIFSVVCSLACSTQGTTVASVDCNAKIKVPHLSAAPFQSRITFHLFDVNEARFETWLTETSAAASEAGAIPVIVGLHLCGTLSTRLTALFTAVAPLAVLVVSPCCLPKRDRAARDKCRLEAWDPYAYWCRCVFEGLDLPADQKFMLVDENVVSEKNTLIWAVKRPQSDTGVQVGSFSS
jgi:hypothetical protein